MRIDYSKLPIINCPICNSEQFNFFTKRHDGGKIVECIRCGHFYLNPPLSKEIIEKIHSEYYKINGDVEAALLNIEEWFQDPYGYYQKTLNWLLQHTSLKEKKILDIGCGIGRFIAECAKYGADVEGIDPNHNLVELANRYYGVRVINDYFDSVEHSGLLKKSSYDVIISLEIIEHVHKPYEFLRKVAELLKPGGYLVISTPNFLLFKLFKLKTFTDFLNTYISLNQED